MQTPYSHIAILGAGESGMGAAQLASKLGVQVFLSEYGTLSAEDKGKLNSWGVRYEEGGHTEGEILKAEAVIKSPGIPHKAAIIQKVKDSGLPVVLCNTHLESFDHDIRQMQIEQLIQTIKTLQQNNPNAAIIIAGDFNYPQLNKFHQGHFCTGLSHIFS